MSTDLPQPGQRIGRYRVEALLGEGGMGAVFAATNDVTGRAVAIKWMLPAMARSDQAVVRFLAEARATARIEHPNVIQVLDVGQDGPAPFLVMERLRGESLGERLQRVGRLSVSETLEVMIPACRGIAEAHAEGIIHRDLKPDNIFLCQGKDGSPRPPKVLDFGISKLYDEGSAHKLTQTGAIMGTPLYMSPEQISAHLDPDPAFDVYAIGVVLYECMSGRPPFDGDSLFALLQRIGTGNATPLHAMVPDVPREVSDVVMRAMHADRGERPGSMTELIADLERLQALGLSNDTAVAQGPPPAAGPRMPPTQVTPNPPLGTAPPLVGAVATGAAPYTPATAAPAPRDRTPLLIVGLVSALVLVLLIVGGGVAYMVIRGTPSAPPSSANVPGQAPGPPTTPVTPVPAPSASANAPEVNLSFTGACAPSFGGRVMVIPSQDTITISATQGYRLSGNLTLGLPASAIQSGSVELSTQGRIDAPDTVVHVMQDQTLWLNIARDASGVLTAGTADPIDGRIVIRSFDAERGTADLTFENVVLQDSRTDGLCTVNGTLRTHGETMGI